MPVQDIGVLAFGSTDERIALSYCSVVAGLIAQTIGRSCVGTTRSRKFSIDIGWWHILGNHWEKHISVRDRSKQIRWSKPVKGLSLEKLKIIKFSHCCTTFFHVALQVLWEGPKIVIKISSRSPHSSLPINGTRESDIHLTQGSVQATSVYARLFLQTSLLWVSISWKTVKEKRFKLTLRQAGGSNKPCSLWHTITNLPLATSSDFGILEEILPGVLVPWLNKLVRSGYKGCNLFSWNHEMISMLRTATIRSQLNCSYPRVSFSLCSCLRQHNLTS